MYNCITFLRPPPHHLPVTTPMQNNTIQYVKTYIYNGFFFNLLTTVLVSFWYKQVSPRNVYFLVFKGTRWPDIPLKHGIHSSFNITSIFISQLCKTHHAYRDSLHLDRFFLYVFYFFFIYILWCGGILIKDILFLYTFRSPITTHYLSLVDRAPTPPHV